MGKAGGRDRKSGGGGAYRGRVLAVVMGVREGGKNSDRGVKCWKLPQARVRTSRVCNMFDLFQQSA